MTNRYYQDQAQGNQPARCPVCDGVVELVGEIPPLQLVCTRGGCRWAINVHFHPALAEPPDAELSLRHQNKWHLTDNVSESMLCGQRGRLIRGIPVEEIDLNDRAILRQYCLKCLRTLRKRGRTPVGE